MSMLRGKLFKTSGFLVALASHDILGERRTVMGKVFLISSLGLSYSTLPGAPGRVLRRLYRDDHCIILFPPTPLALSGTSLQ